MKRYAVIWLWKREIIFFPCKKIKHSSTKRFVHQKSWIRTFNTYFSTTQYPFSILYLPHKYKWILWKTGFKRDFSRCIKINNFQISFEKNDRYVFKASINSYPQQEFLALNTYLPSFSKKSDSKIYINKWDSAILTFIRLEYF